MSLKQQNLNKQNKINRVMAIIYTDKGHEIFSILKIGTKSCPPKWGGEKELFPRKKKIRHNAFYFE